MEAMTINDLLLLPDGRLRAGWRLALFLIVFIGLLFGMSLLFSFTRQAPSVALAVFVQAAAAGISTWLLLRWMEDAPFVSIGLAWQKRAPGELRQGLAVGIALVGTLTAFEWATGAIRFESKTGSGPASTLAGVLMLTGLLVVVATYEEVLFRGYAFQRLVEGTNGTGAILVSSVVFGGVHMTNPNATQLGTLNTVLAGVLLAVAYLRTRALWWPIGFHFGWNWTLAVLGHPVSGLEVAQLPWRVVADFEPVWIHGGSYGPEGGIVATVLLLAGTAGTLRLLRNAEGRPEGLRSSRNGPEASAGGEQPDSAAKN